MACDCNLPASGALCESTPMAPEWSRRTVSALMVNALGYSCSDEHLPQVASGADGCPAMVPEHTQCAHYILRAQGCEDSGTLVVLCSWDNYIVPYYVLTDLGLSQDNCPGSASSPSLPNSYADYLCKFASMITR
jgi:hypothetical protein